VAAVASVQSKAERRSPHGHVETARDEAISLSVAEPRPHRDRTIRAQGDATEGFSPPACQIQLTMHPRFDKTVFGDLTFGRDSVRDLQLRSERCGPSGDKPAVTSHRWFR
jgi:hypothetical protein